MKFYNNGPTKQIRFGRMGFAIISGENNITGHDDRLNSLIERDEDLSLEAPEKEKPKVEQAAKPTQKQPAKVAQKKTEIKKEGK